MGADNKANGVRGVRGVGSVSDISDAVGVDAGAGAGADAGDTTCGGVGGNAASFVPKTDSSSKLSRCLRFLALMLTLP